MAAQVTGGGRQQPAYADSACVTGPWASWRRDLWPYRVAESRHTVSL